VHQPHEVAMHGVERSKMALDAGSIPAWLV
jgi:hypothetical protein